MKKTTAAAFIAIFAFVAIAIFAATRENTSAKAGSGHRGPTATQRSLLVGGRAADISFTTMNNQIGPVKATRIFYTGALPAKFDQSGVPAGVKIIVSYKAPSANTASYVRSIPAGENVEMAFHHEPEGPQDYPGAPSTAGPTFVKDFNAQAAIIRAANPKVKVAFIGGGYEYTGGSTSNRGIGGYFIPTTANDYYLDSYQRTTIVPASSSPSIQHFIGELTKRGHSFNGFTEYGRGVIAKGQKFSQSVADARAKVIALDAKWLAGIPSADTWLYWYTTDLASGDEWRFTDPASIKAWSAVAAHQ